MAQAESITTAIRELMSREQPPKYTSARAAHTEFVAALAGNAPHPIDLNRKPEQLERRADHLQRVLHVYLSAVIADTAQNIPDSTLDRSYLNSLYQRFSAEAPAEIREAAVELRVRENWSGS